ncbi:mechanosensitive ion channel domain-containing protein [Limibacter armeniacum]|uniref:mechanosensitive ion channel family protein n=1 Tax=Limibacter armeniacum TaxID=466084 RepID=UPI002FE65B4A
MKSIEQAYDLLLEKLNSWLESAILILPNFVVACLVVLMFYFLARGFHSATKNILQRFKFDQEIGGLIINIFYIIIMIAGVFVALSIMQLDKTVTSLLAGAGIVGLAISFAFQDIATNFISGVIIAFRKPFREGNFVELNGQTGHIRRISLRSVHLHTLQGQEVIMPAKEVLQNAIINFSSFGERRVDIPVGVSYGDDLEKAARVAIEAVNKVEERDPDRKVELYYDAFGDSSINFTIRFWLAQNTVRSFLHARHNAIIEIHKAFNEHDITIPFPIRTLDFGIKGGEKLKSMLNGSVNQKIEN